MNSPVATVAVTNSGNALVFVAEADAQVVQALPTTNFGTSATLQSSGGSGSAQTSFIRFKITGMHDTVQDIKLRVFCTQGAADGPAAYLADNNWTESGTDGVTWSNQPQLLSSELDNKGAIETGTWVEYDVASLVTGNGTYTFALVADSADEAIFSSREGSQPPQLVVTFAP